MPEGGNDRGLGYALSVALGVVLGAGAVWLGIQGRPARPIHLFPVAVPPAVEVRPQVRVEVPEPEIIVRVPEGPAPVVEVNVPQAPPPAAAAVTVNVPDKTTVRVENWPDLGQIEGEKIPEPKR